MSALTLACSTNDFVLDASGSSIAMNSGAGFSISVTTKFSVAGAVQFSSFGAGFAAFDALGNLSSVAGSLFSTSTPYTVSAAWTHSGVVTHSAAILYTGVASQASALGVGTTTVPAGWKYAIINDSTGEIRKMT